MTVAILVSTNGAGEKKIAKVFSVKYLKVVFFSLMFSDTVKRHKQKQKNSVLSDFQLKNVQL